MNEYFPPSSMVFTALGDDLKGSESEHLSVSRGLLRRLIQVALENTVFDAEKYLAANPDLRDAWKNKQITDLHKHWVEAGYFEGRRASTPDVDEKFYLLKYPDVRQAVEAGKIRDGAEHFVSSGEQELRIPNAAVEDAIELWRRAMFAQMAPIAE